MAAEIPEDSPLAEMLLPKLLPWAPTAIRASSWGWGSGAQTGDTSPGPGRLSAPTQQTARRAGDTLSLQATSHYQQDSSRGHAPYLCSSPMATDPGSASTVGINLLATYFSYPCSAWLLSTMQKSSRHLSTLSLLFYFSFLEIIIDSQKVATVVQGVSGTLDPVPRDDDNLHNGRTVSQAGN